MTLRLLMTVHPLFHRRGYMESCFICRMVWRRLMQLIAFTAELERGIADIEVGRYHRLSDIRQES